MVWQIRIEKRAQKDLQKLVRADQLRIYAFLQSRLANQKDPPELGEALTGPLSGFWKYRVGSYRLISLIEDRTITISIIRIGHRREIYR